MSKNLKEAADDEIFILIDQHPLRVEYNRPKEMILLIDDWSASGPHIVTISAHLWPALARIVEERIETAHS